MKYKLIIILLIFSNIHASSSCKAITLLMTYDEISRILHGKIENCSEIDKNLYPNDKKYLDSLGEVQYASPNCINGKLALGFTNGYLSSIDDVSLTISKDNSTMYPSHFKPCLSEKMVQLGMSYQQISNILKKEGELASKPYTNSYGIYMSEYVWDIGGIGSISISFENNKAINIKKND